MDTKKTSYSPAEYERMYLPKLEGQNQQVLSYLQQLAAAQPGQRALTPDEILAIIRYLQAWDQTFLTYESWAQYLSQSGLPQMSIRLAQIRKDLHGAIGVYAQIYQSALNAQNEIFRIQADANTYCTKVMMDTNTRRQQVFDRCNQMHDLVLYRGYPMYIADLITRLGG